MILEKKRQKNVNNKDDFLAWDDMQINAFEQ